MYIENTDLEPTKEEVKNCYKHLTKDSPLSKEIQYALDVTLNFAIEQCRFEIKEGYLLSRERISMLCDSMLTSTLGMLNSPITTDETELLLMPIEDFIEDMINAYKGVSKTKVELVKPTKPPVHSYDKSKKS